MLQVKNATFMRYFSERFIARRRGIGLSQKQAAELLRISPRTVAAWEAGENTPHPNKIRDIAEKLRVHPRYFSDETLDDKYLIGEQNPGLGLLHERPNPYGSNATQCMDHLRLWIEQIGSDPDMVSWTLVELRRKFPVGQSPAKPIPSRAPNSSAAAEDVRLIGRCEGAENGPTSKPSR
jgi:transcriptional regulator with XRE-family HTH domain